MNKEFAEHVTNTAFFLSVSKKQIRYISVLFHTPFPNRGYFERPFGGGRSDPDNWIASYGALKKKGLVEWIVDDPDHGRGHYALTKAGKLLAEMLIEAGLIMETLPVSEAAA